MTASDLLQMLHRNPTPMRTAARGLCTAEVKQNPSWKASEEDLVRLASQNRFAGSGRDWQEAGCNYLGWMPARTLRLTPLPARMDAADT